MCVSGGEPTLSPNLKAFLSRLKVMGFKVKLDTNGTNPDVLKSVIDEGLVDYIAMDIKNSIEKYSITAGVSNSQVDKIVQSINILINSKIDYEFRTTLVEEFHTHEDIKNMANLLKGAKRIYLQKFNSSQFCIKKDLSSVSKEVAESYVSLLKQSIDEVSLRGYI